MNFKVFSDSFEGYAKRSTERAKRISRKERIEPSRSITFEDPLQMVAVLTPERIRLCLAARTGTYSVSALAGKLGRDVSAVRRDVEKLETIGLLTTSIQANPGHGKARIVTAAANRFELRAAF